jgi:alpha-L-fucosidase
MFSKNLTAAAKLTASNVRGSSRNFGPKNLIDGSRRTYWATDDGVHRPEVTLAFPSPVTFSTIRIREYIPLGQRVAAFAVETDDGGAWRTIASGTSIGNCRLVRLPREATARQVRLRITESLACQALCEFSLF